MHDLGKGAVTAGKMGKMPPCLSLAPARFSHFFLLNDFPPLSRSMEQASVIVAGEQNIRLSLDFWYRQTRLFQFGRLFGIVSLKFSWFQTEKLIGYTKTSISL